MIDAQSTSCIRRMLCSRGTAPEAKPLTDQRFAACLGGGAVASTEWDDTSSIFDWLQDTKGFPRGPQSVKGVTTPVKPEGKSSTFPTWSDNALATDVVMRMRADPEAVIGNFQRFLDSSVEAVLEREPIDKFRLKATVFIRYVPMRIEMRVYEAELGTVAVLSDTARKDVVLFRHICSLLADYMRSNGFEVLDPMPPVPDLWPELVDFDGFDFPDHDLEAWPERIKPVLADACSKHKTLREDALSVLAQWAASAPECHMAMARAMVACSGFMTNAEQVLAEEWSCTPEVFVLRACFKHVCSCPEAEDLILSNGLSA